MAEEKAAATESNSTVGIIAGVVIALVVVVITALAFTLGGNKLAGKWTLVTMVDKEYKEISGMTDEVRDTIKGQSKIEFKGDKKCVLYQKSETSDDYKSIDTCTYDDKKIKITVEGQDEEQEYEYKDGAVYISAGENGKLKYERE